MITSDELIQGFTASLAEKKLISDVTALRVRAGVAARTPAMTNMEELLKAADLGVYAAKRKGRNCVAMAGST